MKHFLLLSILIVFSCSSQKKSEVSEETPASVIAIVNKINEKLKASDFSPKAIEKIVNDGLPMFETFIQNTKEITDMELESWVEMYRTLESYGLKSTERTDKFILELVESSKIDADLSSRLKIAYRNKIYFKELPESTTDINGVPIKISDYNDKLVLIDFWATWCGPCISELPNVKEAYSKYKSKGFDILGISLDSDLDKLNRFIEKKDMPWRHISDGKQWSSKFARHYGINSIPATFLLKNGKIVAKNLRGKALDAAIEKHLTE